MNPQTNKLEHLFNNRALVIATMHKKEEVIAPLLTSNLGVNCFVPPNFDTDNFGSFSGEKSRINDPVTTLRNKCEMAMNLTNCDIGVASEGSFGTHPHLFFSNADDELVMLLDKKNNLEIVARELSTSINFGGAEINSQEELLSFAKSYQFPSHGLILRSSKNSLKGLIKNFKHLNHLKTSFHELYSQYGSVYIETDMRAMMNPTRMDIIAIATNRLIDKVKSLCPSCETPGFAIEQSKPGLPCSTCGFPTRSTLYHLWSCKKCTYSKREEFPYGKNREEAMYCDYCNP